MDQPLVTIGLISCNRLHYLKALIESAVQCIEYDHIEWIIIDNASIEPGLREYIEGLDFITHKIFMKERSPSTEHVEAMNKIVELSRGKYLMLLPEDVQFIVKGSWMKDFVEITQKHHDIGCICFDSQRRITINKLFHSKSKKLLFWKKKPTHHIYRSSTGREFIGYGDLKPGIAGAGILTFACKDKWEKLGLWKATNKQTVADSSGGGETEMLRRYEKAGFQWERVLTKIPIAADIITDPRGTKARIRGNRRYGKYFPPPQGKFYYKIWKEEDLAKFINNTSIPFEDNVIPLGFDLPQDKNNNILKNPHINENDNFEWIQPSVEGKRISSN